jgi:hypothetical protein
MSKEKAISSAVKEALDSCAGTNNAKELKQWVIYDSKRLMNHCLGDCRAQLRIDNIEVKNDGDIAAEVMKQVCQRLFKMEKD